MQRMLKDLYGDDIAVVFIGPCIGKKNEADENDGLIDVSITFEELKFGLPIKLVIFQKLKRKLF